MTVQPTAWRIGARMFAQCLPLCRHIPSPTSSTSLNGTGGIQLTSTTAATTTAPTLVSAAAVTASLTPTSTAAPAIQSTAAPTTSPTAPSTSTPTQYIKAQGNQQSDTKAFPTDEPIRQMPSACALHARGFVNCTSALHTRGFINHTWLAHVRHRGMNRQAQLGCHLTTTHLAGAVAAGSDTARAAGAGGRWQRCCKGRQHQPRQDGILAPTTASTATPTPASSAATPKKLSPAAPATPSRDALNAAREHPGR